MRKGVRCELDSVGLPDAFLLAGALPTLHDRYGISTAKIVEKKLSIVCVNRAAMTRWPLSALSGLLPSRQPGAAFFLQILCGLSQNLLDCALHGIVVLPSLIAIIS